MRSAQISFKNKKVIIIGGGKQGCKKANDFLKEEAKVQVIATHFHDAILEEVRVYKEYEEKDIQDAFLVYACTDNKDLNHRIVVDANKRNILSANVHKDEEATYHPLYTSEFENMHVAYSTKGASPAYLKKVETSFHKLYEEEFKSVLEDLKAIREYILSSSLDADTRRNLLKEVAEMTNKDIQFYKSAIQEQKALVLVFHGNDSKEAIMKIEEMISNIHVPCTYALLKKDTSHPLEEIKNRLDLLGVKTKYQPMFLEDGYCANKMRSIIEEKGEDLLFDEDLIEEVNKVFVDERQVLLVIHDTKSGNLKHKLQQKLSNNIIVMELNEEIPTLYKKEVCLSGLFVLSGKHLKVDVLSEEGIYGRLVEKGYIVKKEYRSLIEMNILNKKLNVIYK